MKPKTAAVIAVLALAAFVYVWLSCSAWLYANTWHP